ncbi:bifunctional nuclease family protein [Mesotoga sp.]|uniref:bifunctional nuclease family protein n=1 Tax=Mesotoga sp. TaxID=2053577 RepID=UPI003567E885
MLQVRLRGLALDQSNSPVVILEVEKTNKGFGIWIGPFEAEALALAVSGKDFPRPLTYDLFLNTVAQLGGNFEKAVIGQVKDNIYYATLHLQDRNGQFYVIDARPSDCLVLAVKKGFPIFVEDAVFVESSIDLSNLQTDTLQHGSEEENEGFKKFVENLDIEELKKHFRGKDENNESS